MKLSPCPFCGRRVTINRMSDDWGTWFFIHGVQDSKVYCSCRVVMESERFYENDSADEINAKHAALIERWNQRVWSS